MKRSLHTLLWGIPLLFSLWACDLTGGEGPVPVPDEYERVVILYSAGYNTISDYLQGDIRELLDSPSAYLPVRGGKKAFLVVTHQTGRAYDFTNPTSPYLLRISRNYDGSARCDTLLTLEKGTRVIDVPVCRSLLEYIGEHFPSRHYGMIFSSHGTGWLPKGYYGSEKSDDAVIWAAPRPSGTMSAPAELVPEGAVPYTLPDPDDIPVKSLGNEVEQDARGKSWAYEMDLPEFVQACPLHFDYLLMDACLMGGIETAYEFRNIADYIGFSAAEIPAEGFYYSGIPRHLLYDTPADPMSVCSDYYIKALSRSGSQRTAVVSFIDCSKLEALAQVCRTIFEKYRTGLNTINPGKVQGFFRHNQHFFYDLQDIVINAGASGEDLAAFQTALSDCVLYLAFTERAMSSIVVDRFCGFSMYLPCHGNAKLNDFYKGLAWNKATALVK